MYGTVVRSCSGSEFQMIGDADVKERFVRVRCSLGVTSRDALDDLRVRGCE